LPLSQALCVGELMPKGEATRSRILDTAMQMASRDGLDGLTIGALSEALSLSKSGLFAHFGSKEALQLAVLEHTRGKFAAHLEPRIQGIAKGLPALSAFMQAWLDWAASSSLPAGCPILGATFELEAREGPARDYLLRLHGDVRTHLSGILQDAMRAGHLGRDTDVAQLIFELRGIVLAFHEALHVSRSSHARTYANRALAAALGRYTTVVPSKAKRPAARRG
jgi:AcrR family transcriptional regulator